MPRASLLLLMPNATHRRRWHDVLGKHYDVHAAADLAEARTIASTPTLCVVDIEALGADGEPLVVVVRGLYRQAELIGVGARPSLSALVSGVNDANMRRFLELDASDEEIVARLQQVWRESSSQHLLRKRLEEITNEHHALMQEHQRLIAQLTTSESDLADFTSSQESLRGRLQTLVDPTGLTNCLTFEGLKIRVSEEITKYERHGLALCMLLADLEYDGSPGRDVNDRVRAAVADKVRHIDLVAIDPNNRLLVLMPVTSRDQAERVRERVAGAADTWRLPVRLRGIEILGYPEDGARVELYSR
jgi:hypothetical protein